MKRITLSLPILVKEMRARMRGVRAPVLLFITTGLAIAVGLVLIFLASNGDYGGTDYSDEAEIGRTLFVGMMVMQGIICALIAPALTAGTLTTEKEQQTLEALLLTRLSSANIALGKLLSALSFLFIILLCSLPVMGISFLLGGVDLRQFFWALGIILSNILLFGAIGLFCSACYKKTATAVTLAYLYSLVWIFYPVIVIVYVNTFSNLNGSNDIHDLKCLPFLTIIGFAYTWIPAAVLSISLGIVLRRSLSRLANTILWIALAAFVVGLIYLCTDLLDNFIILGDNSIWIVIGSPLLSIGIVLFPDNVNFSSSPPLFIERYFVVLSIAATLLCAGLVFMAAVRGINRLRDHPPAPAFLPKRRKRGKGAKSQDDSRAPRDEFNVNV